MDTHIKSGEILSESLPSADNVYKTSASSITLLMVCCYIFLVIERPWESIRYFESFPIQRTFAIFMIIIAFWEGKFKIVKSPTNKWVYGILALHFALSPFAFSPSFAFDEAIEYAKVVVLYLLMLSVIEDESSLEILVKAFIFSMMIYVLHSLWEFHNGRYVWRMGIVRMIGVDSFLSDPNAFGASIVLSFPFTYSLFKTGNTKIAKLMYLGYFFIGIACIVLTGSRSSFLAFMVLLFLWAFLQQGKKKIFVFLLGIISIGIIWGYMPEDKQDRIRTLWDDNAGPESAYQSAEGRWQGWEASWEMFKRNPITGVGPGGRNFVGYRTTHQVDKVPGFSHKQSHILYGQVLAEQGIFGAILFAGLVFSIVRSCLSIHRSQNRIERKTNFSFYLNGSIIVALALLLFLGFGGHNFYRPLWLWLAAWVSGLRKIDKGNRSSPLRPAEVPENSL